MFGRAADGSGERYAVICSLSAMVLALRAHIAAAAADEQAGAAAGAAFAASQTRGPKLLGVQVSHGLQLQSYCSCELTRVRSCCSPY